MATDKKYERVMCFCIAEGATGEFNQNSEPQLKRLLYEANAIARYKRCKWFRLCNVHDETLLMLPVSQGALGGGETELEEDWPSDLELGDGKGLWFVGTESGDVLFDPARIERFSVDEIMPPPAVMRSDVGIECDYDAEISSGMSGSADDASSKN